MMLSLQRNFSVFSTNSMYLEAFQTPNARAQSISQARNILLAAVKAVKHPQCFVSSPSKRLVPPWLAVRKHVGSQAKRMLLRHLASQPAAFRGQCISKLTFVGRSCGRSSKQVSGTPDKRKWTSRCQSTIAATSSG
jgi:hypothetical protein